MSVAEVFVSTRSRPLMLRMRNDLVVVEQAYRNEKFYLIKDPLEMEFYRLNEEEYFVLTHVDGERSLEQLQIEFESRFAGQRVKARELQGFISDLHRKSLLAYSGGEVGIELIGRAKQKHWDKLKQNLKGILSLKWRGVDPDRFLDWLTPKVGWLFSTPMVILASMLMICAGLWVLVNLDILLSRLPSLGEFLKPRNWLLLGSVIIVMKVIHELAHGVSFKRYGGECHEIGVMLLLFIPTLYCSTTDSWMLRSRFQRMAIAAAGMYVELFMAAIATFLWWFTEPGTLNSLCLNVMASGSFSVLLLNGNPFLKYDGYYILSDMLELPNLLERGGKVTQSYFLKYGLGVDEPEEVNSVFSTKMWLLWYRLATFAFRIFVIYLILWMMIKRLRPVGLQNVGVLLAIASAGFLLVPPLWSLYKFFKVPGRVSRIEMTPAIRTVLVTLAIVLLLVAIPFPHHVTCGFTIRPRGEQSVFVEHDALLKRVLVEPHTFVEQGDLIAELENLDSSLELAAQRTALVELQKELALLTSARQRTATEATRINELQGEIATRVAAITELSGVVASFQVRAPRTGWVVPEWVSPKQQGSSEMLEPWQGSPLARENLGTMLRGGEKLCTIGDLKTQDAVLAINEADVAYVRVQQEAVLMLDSASGKRMTGTIQSIAHKDAEQLPEALAKNNGGAIEIAPTGGPKSGKQPTDEHFEARVPLETTQIALSRGLRGLARIRVGKKTILQRFWMKLNRELSQQL